MSFCSEKAAFRERLVESVKHEKNGLVGVMQSIVDDFGRQLHNEKGKGFAERWLLHTFASELLKYSIEDDRIRLDDSRPEIAERLGNLLTDKNWLTPDLISFLESYRKVATLDFFPALRTEIKLPMRGTPSGDCIFTGWVTKKKGDQFQVSRKYVPFVSILEDSLANPDYAESVLNGFSAELERLKKENRINWLCFIEKAVGPVGALSMLGALVSKLHLPACIYRAGYWSQRAKLVGYRPPRDAKVAIVYDLFVTGDGIKQVATELRRDFQVPVVAAVVLYTYADKPSIMDEDNQIIQIRSIASDTMLRPEVMQIVERGVKKTKHIRLTNGRGFNLSVARGELSLSTRKKRSLMKPAIERDWKPDLGLYENKKALKFLTAAALEKAVELTVGGRGIHRHAAFSRRRRHDDSA